MGLTLGQMLMNADTM